MIRASESVPHGSKTVIVETPPFNTRNELAKRFGERGKKRLGIGEFLRSLASGFERFPDSTRRGATETLGANQILERLQYDGGISNWRKPVSCAAENAVFALVDLAERSAHESQESSDLFAAGAGVMNASFDGDSGFRRPGEAGFGLLARNTAHALGNTL
jgi:hypothetical protein